MIKNNTNLDALNGLKYELQIIEDQKTQELKDLKLFLKLYNRKFGIQREEITIKMYVSLILSSGTHCCLCNIQLGLRQKQLDSWRMRNTINRLIERNWVFKIYIGIVVLHKYQESGVEVHHAYTKYIQSENLKGLRDLPHSYKLLEQDLEIEVERKRQLKQQLESQKKQTEELLQETRKN